MDELLCWRGTPKAEQATLEAQQKYIDGAHKYSRELKRRIECAFGEAEK
jgi:hypothetical protein